MTFAAFYGFPCTGTQSFVPHAAAQRSDPKKRIKMKNCTGLVPHAAGHTERPPPDAEKVFPEIFISFCGILFCSSSSSGQVPRRGDQHGNLYFAFALCFVCFPCWDVFRGVGIGTGICILPLPSVPSFFLVGISSSARGSARESPLYNNKVAFGCLPIGCLSSCTNRARRAVANPCSLSD